MTIRNISLCFTIVCVCSYLLHRLNFKDSPSFFRHSEWQRDMKHTQLMVKQSRSSPMYWIVPHMVNALPPRRSRRESPKSDRRRWPESKETHQKVLKLIYVIWAQMFLVKIKVLYLDRSIGYSPAGNQRWRRVRRLLLKLMHLDYLILNLPSRLCVWCPAHEGILPRKIRCNINTI